jgi:transposase
VSAKRRTFSDEFKAKVLGEVRSGKPVAEVTRRYNLSKNAIYDWQTAAATRSATVEINQSDLSALQTKVADLEKLVGRLTLENDILKKLEEYQEHKENQNQ